MPVSSAAPAFQGFQYETRLRVTAEKAVAGGERMLGKQVYSDEYRFQVLVSDPDGDGNGTVQRCVGIPAGPGLDYVGLDEVCTMASARYDLLRRRCIRDLARANPVQVQVSPSAVLGSEDPWVGAYTRWCPPGKYVGDVRFSQYHKSGGDKDSNGLTMTCYDP
jgi:hypothetical protein